MPLEVKQGRKVGIFLKNNVPTDKSSFVEREVFVTLQGSRTGKETKVKLKINAGKRHPAIQSNTGAVTLSENGQIVETFNPSQLPEEIQEELKEELIEKLEELKDEKITKPKSIEEVMDEVVKETASGENRTATATQVKAAKASIAKAAALSEKLASKGITKGKGKSKTTYTPPTTTRTARQRDPIDDFDDSGDI